MKPRPYQERTLEELWTWFSKHPEGDPIVEACVGAGKSLLIALLCQRAITEFPGTRIVVLVHQKELLEQNLEKLQRIWPAAPLGVFSAAAGWRQLGRSITYATIGSIYKHAHNVGRVDLILADECHLINPKQAGMWRQFIFGVRMHSPNARVIGWTGTAFRGNGIWLTAGDNALFSAVATRVKMTELLELGFLAPLKPAATETRIETDDVRTLAGEYVISDLAEAVDKPALVAAACAEIVRLAASRRRWLVFAVTVAHAEHVCEELQRLGIAADIVTGETPKGEREQLIADYRRGKLRALVNVGVLTTGFDVPEVDCIALLRPTKSPVLYVQIAGRGMRCIGADINESIARGKADCLWLDFTSTTADMGPVDAVKGRMPAPKGEAPFKYCPECGSTNPASALFCSSCGHEFPPPVVEEKPPHGTEASAAAVLSSQAPATTDVEVTRVAYSMHLKRGDELAPATLRVDYFSGLNCIGAEWVCLDHVGFPRRKAEMWWSQRMKIDAIPASVKDALEWLEYDQRILRVPSSVVTVKDGKYTRIIGYAWNEQGGQGRADQVSHQASAGAGA